MQREPSPGTQRWEASLWIREVGRGCLSTMQTWRRVEGMISAREGRGGDRDPREARRPTE